MYRLGGRRTIRSAPFRYFFAPAGRPGHHRQTDLEDTIRVLGRDRLVVDGLREAEPSVVGLALLALLVVTAGGDT